MINKTLIIVIILNIFILSFSKELNEREIARVKSFKKWNGTNERFLKIHIDKHGYKKLIIEQPLIQEGKVMIDKKGNIKSFLLGTYSTLAVKMQL